MAVNIPTPDVLPALPGKVREGAYFVLSYVAGLLWLVASVALVLPQFDLEKPLVVANVIVNGLWFLLGGKAAANVDTNVKA